MSHKNRIFLFLLIPVAIAGVVLGFWAYRQLYYTPHKNTAKKLEEARDRGDETPVKVWQIGDAVDSLDGVEVYYNGGIMNVQSRNVAADGYNLGLKYQCVEFVKRYYYVHLRHKMPDSYGHAKDFFDKSLGDGTYNPKRGLYQYSNPSKHKPQPKDLIIWKGNALNPYGHVAIVSDTFRYDIEIVQQNPGPQAPSRERIPYGLYKGQWKVMQMGIVGWLRKK